MIISCFSLQTAAQAVLFMCMNTAGIFISYLSDRAQRQAFLETRRCVEARLRLETENQRQVRPEGTPGKLPSCGLHSDLGFATVEDFWPRFCSCKKLRIQNIFIQSSGLGLKHQFLVKNTYLKLSFSRLKISSRPNKNLETIH